jgi:hypothetical protein
LRAFPGKDLRCRPAHPLTGTSYDDATILESKVHEASSIKVSWWQNKTLPLMTLIELIFTDRTEKMLKEFQVPGSLSF